MVEFKNGKLDLKITHKTVKVKHGNRRFWKTKILVDGKPIRRSDPMYRRVLGKSPFCFNPKYLAFMEVLSSFDPKNDEIPVHYEKVVLDFAEKNKDLLRKLDEQGDAGKLMDTIKARVLEMFANDKELKNALYFSEETLLLAAYDLARLAGIGVELGKTDKDYFVLYYKGAIASFENGDLGGFSSTMASTPREACALAHFILNLDKSFRSNLSESAQDKERYLMESISHIEEALKFSTKLYSDIGAIYLEMGNVYFEFEKYKEASEKYVACFNYAKDYGTKVKVVRKIVDSAILSEDVYIKIKAYRVIERLAKESAEQGQSQKILKSILSLLETEIIRDLKS